MVAKISMVEALKTAPTNWGRWGPDDEIGSLNFMTNSEILRAVRSVRQGKVIPLGLLIGRKEGDLVFTGRAPASHFMAIDEGHYKSGKLKSFPGDIKYTDDAVFIYLHGSTQCDALGHEWSGSQIYNGYSADTTMGGMAKAGIVPIASHGVVGRGILLDIPKYKGKRRLDRDEMITLDDILGAAKKQGVKIEKHDILVFRTGFITVFYEDGAEVYFKDGVIEPGITYTKELVDWFHTMEITGYASDTISSEQWPSQTVDAVDVMHVFLMSRLGIVINELLWLEDLAQDCDKDHQYDFLYIASPLKIVGGTGSPINPVALK